MILGLGRGAGKVRVSTAFRLDMGLSRELFVEYGEALLKGPSRAGVMAYDGKHYKQPPVAIRPAPVQELPAAAPMPPRSVPERRAASWPASALAF